MGNLAAGDTVYVSVNNGTTWTAATATVGSNTWSLTGVTLNGGTDGTNTLQVKVSDAAGNTSTPVYTHSYTLDTTPPTTVSAISGYAESVGSVTGTEASPLTITTTDASTVELVGTNGALQAGEAIWVYKDGTYLGTASAIDSTHWKLTGVTVDTSSHIYTVKVTDAAGNTLAGTGSQALALDTTPPSEYALTAALSADTAANGGTNTDFITKTAAQTITGTLSGNVASGDTVYVSLNNGATWTAATAAVGANTWSLANATLLSGTNTLLVKVADAAGNSSTPVYSHAYTLDTTAPTETVASATLSADTGISSTDFITNTAAQTISGTLSANLVAGDTVYVSLNGGSTWTAATATVGTNTWSLSGATLLSGNNTLDVKVTDVAGNDTTFYAQAYTLKTTPPTEIVASATLSADTGISSTDFITNTAAQTISGTLSANLVAGDTVYVSLNGGATWTAATATVGTNTWSLFGATLLSGTNILDVKVTDTAGNSTITYAQAYTLKTTPPSEYVITAALSADTGISNTDFITSVASQTITGTLSGSVATGDTVYVSLNGGSTWTAATASVGSSTWTLANATLLSGANTLMVKVSDAAGNTSTPVYTQAYTYSNATPNFSNFTINSAITTDTASTNTALGVSGTTFGGTTPQNSDGITRDTSLVLTGLVSGVTAGDILQYSSNGGTTWNNATLAGTGATTWTVTDVTAQTTTGTVTYTFRVMNALGNIQTLSGTKSVTIDVTAPTMTIKAPVLTSAYDTGTLGDNTTTATSLTFTSATQGTGEVGATVALISDVNGNGIYDPLVDKVLGTATVTTGGVWSITNSTALTTGSYKLGFIEYDAAGNYTRLTPTTTINIVANDGATTTGGLSVTSGLAAWTGTGVTAGTNMQAGIDANGNLLLGVSDNIVKQTSLSSGTVAFNGGATSGYNYQATLADYNRNGYVDMVGSGLNSKMGYAAGSSSGYPASLTSITTNSSTYATVAWDYNGDGWVDFISAGGNGAGSSNNILKNTNGTLSLYTGSAIYKSDGVTVENSFSGSYEVSTADFMNMGLAGLAVTTSNSSNAGNIYIIQNAGQNAASMVETTVLSGVVPLSTNAVTELIWGDFTGSGLLSLVTTRSNGFFSGGLYTNTGGGVFSTSGTAIGNNTVNGYQAGAAIDWNHDGAMDVVRLSVIGANTIELNTNNGSGTFTTTNLTSSGTAITTLGAVQGISTADVNWDGAADLVYTYTSGSTTGVATVLNTNAVTNGTSLNIKISDPGGVNSYFGNTVKLFDTTANTLVSTQVLNQQDGLYYNDSTGILHFYGLNANDTYSVVMIRSNGTGSFTSNDVGGQARYTDSSATTLSTVENVDASWSGIKTSTANSAINLIANGGASTSSTASYVGTGYNDTFFVENLNSSSKVASGGTLVTTENFNGGGGWTLGLGGTASTWVTTGGMNVVDMTQAGSNAVVVNLNTGTGSVSAWGETLGFTSIQGIKLGAGAATVTDGGSGDNEFWLGTGQATLTLGNATGHDVLAFNQLTSGVASGGFNAGNTVSGFTVGAVTTTAKSTILDLRGVLRGYLGTATVYWDVTTSKYVLDQDSQALLQYLNIVLSGSNTLVQVDATGNGNWQTIATLSGVSTDLATLIGNNQLWVAGSNPPYSITVTAESTTSTTPIVQGTLDASLSVSSGTTVNVTINGTTYSSTNGAVTVDYTNHTWYVKPTSALAVGTYDVSASVLNSAGIAIGSDATTNELTITAGGGTTPADAFKVTSGLANWSYVSPTYGASMAASIDASGNLILGVGNNIVEQTSLSSGKVVFNGGTTSGYNFMSALADYNRDSYADMVGTGTLGSPGKLSSVTGTSSPSVYNPNPNSITAGYVSSYASATIAWDYNGDGWVDFINSGGNGTAASNSILKNTAGTLSLANMPIYKSGGTVVESSITNSYELSAADFMNTGLAGLAITSALPNPSTGSIYIISNTGSVLTETQILQNATEYAAGGGLTELIWGDFTGSGYLSLVSTVSTSSFAGSLYTNLGGGTFSTRASIGSTSNNNMQAGVAIDWNHDGAMDIVRMSTFLSTPIELDTNNGNGTFTTSNLTSGGSTVSVAYVQGISTADVNWDGAADLVYDTGNNGVYTVLNTNTVTNGTSLNIKISDPNGINSYFGNTVKLFDTTTNTLVSTQVLNQQDGLYYNDSTGILHFYGLNANDTYSVVMIRSTTSGSNDVGGQASYTDSSASTLTTVENVDTTWGNIHTSTANSSLNLIADGGASTSATANFVGTGYNDTFFYENLNSSSKVTTGGTLVTAENFNGGGGWYTDASGAQVWTNAGGMNILDFSSVGSTGITLDLSSSSAQTVATGWSTVTLTNIEGVAGGAGNDTFTNSGGNDQMQGRGGNNTYNLTHAGGHDTLLYTVQTAVSNTGGNGPDVANGFKVGVYEAVADADVINLKALLVGYTAGTGAHYVNGVATIDSGETIGNYLTVTNSGSDTILSIDRDGTGSTYSSAQLLTLHNVTTNLATLMANHQIIVA